MTEDEKHRDKGKGPLKKEEIEDSESEDLDYEIEEDSTESEFSESDDNSPSKSPNDKGQFHNDFKSPINDELTALFEEADEFGDKSDLGVGLRSGRIKTQPILGKRMNDSNQQSSSKRTK